MDDFLKTQNWLKSCSLPLALDEKYRAGLPDIVAELIESCNNDYCFDHVDAAIIPSRESVIEIIEIIKDILFPGYFGQQEIDRHSLEYHIGNEIITLYEKMSRQITKSILHECRRYQEECSSCVDRGQEESLLFMKKLPALRQTLSEDVRAAFDGDPAVKSFDEVIFSYPGLLAITIYRTAHELYSRNIPLVPRIMTEYAHSITGIDIHPGAQIGERFFIDHGTGVVIGETAIIGKNVKIYQGVTLGSLNFPKDEEGNLLRNIKRHPTIEDEVIIYANAAILGGNTVIGARSVIGGNVWLTHSVPPDTKVMLKNPDLIFKPAHENHKPQKVEKV
jgi:serine O-acetyltransferase